MQLMANPYHTTTFKLVDTDKDFTVTDNEIKAKDYVSHLCKLKQ